MVLKPPTPSNYNQQTWIGREKEIRDLLPKLQEHTHLLWITGISGIGKTALGECLASQSWQRAPSFQWIYLEILKGQSPDFVSVAADLLAKLGDRELNPQERNNPEQLAKRLLQKLQFHPYWIQMDSLERLLKPEQPTNFIDPYWVIFLQRCLTDSNIVSRLVLTAQAFPAALVEFSDRYPNAWAEIRLDGLLQVEQQLEFFTKRGVMVEPSNRNILSRVAQIYEGHPLVLKVIAEDILNNFTGDVDRYWQVYQPEFEQVTRELQATRLDETEYNEALDRKVRERIKRSLEQLSADAFDLLCRSAVFRRPVPKKFWLAMIGDRSSKDQKAAYRVLDDRALIEKESTDIRQHNLIRDVAYDLLCQDPSMWETAERQAANLWLTAYKPSPNAPKLETVRGYLEAFAHYCEVEDWEVVSELFMKFLKPPSKSELFWLLYQWGHYREEIELCKQLVKYVRPEIKVVCYNGIGLGHYALANYYQALSAYQQSLTIARETGDKRSESIAICNMGVVYKNLGDYKQAIGLYEIDLAISREISDKWGEACTLGNLGLAYNDIGEYRQALKYHFQALEMRKDTNDQRGEAADLGNIGLSYYNLREYELAIDFHQRCLKLTRDLGNRRDECNALVDLGLVYHALGDYQKALDYHQEALRIALEINDRRAEGTALSDMGSTLIQVTRYEAALENLNRALAIFREIQASAKEAEVLKNLAELHQAQGEFEMAQQYCHQALALATELGIPLAAECEALLKEIEEEG